MKTNVIGIDFSTAPYKTAMARACVDAKSSVAEIFEVCFASKRQSPAGIAANWIHNFSDDSRVLIAIDAPMGWPVAMRCEKFVQHSAGQRVNICVDKLFLRETDRQIESRLSKKPLSVGADKIARTAHAALNFLNELSDELQIEALPLAWSSSGVQESEVSVIEVYPAATLRKHNVNSGKYKKPGNEGLEDRRRIVESLTELNPRINIDRALKKDVSCKDDSVDAVICVLAGLEFLAGISAAPEDRLREHAKREGWIWV